MRTMRNRIMELILVAFLLTGCVLSTSGEDINKPAINSVDVQNIFNNFDALIKLKSTVPTVSDHVCVTSVDELNEIENAFVRNEDRVPDSREVDVSIKFSSNCSKLDRLKTEILKLRNHFAEMIAEPILSHTYRALKTNLESKILQFKSFLDDTKKMESGERLDMAVKLQNEFQSQQNRIVEVLGKLESEQKRLNDANVQVAIDHLQQGKLDEAVAAFAIVTDHDTHIERVVKSVYGNGDNFENICRFVVRSPLRSKENGYKALREQMKKDNRMPDQHIWILAAEIHHLYEEDRGALEGVMVDVKTMVRNNNLDGLIAILNKPGGVEVIKNFAPILVRTIYEETDNSGVEKFLTVLKKIPTIRHKLYLINELILMLKSTGRMHGKDMSMIIFELIKLRSEKKPQHKSWEQIVELNLPAQLRDLMYDFLCIRNAENEEYLFAGTPVNENQRLVHTARTHLNESFYWRVYFTDDGTKIRIKSSKYSEPIYLIDEGSPDDEHVLRSWMTGPLTGNKTAEFYLDMLGNGEFLIVNKYFGQLLYSPFDNEPNPGNNRPVFSKKYDPNNIEIDSKWIIGVCRVDVEHVFN